MENNRQDYQLTFLDDKGLISRLSDELKGVASDYQLTWPEFKRDPKAFISRGAKGYAAAGRKFITNRNNAAALTASFAILILAVVAFIAADYVEDRRAENLARQDQEQLVLESMVTDIPKEEKPVEKGNAGMAKGSGGGSKPKMEKPQGGGGGGRMEQKPASFGKLPPAVLQPQIIPPSPHPPKIKNPSLPVVATIDADPKLFPTDTRPIPYGDPKSKSTEISSGPGTGGGIGTGEGGGVGSGSGGGVGPGRGGNTGGGDRREGGGGAGGGGGGGGDTNRTMTAKEVTRKAVIISKPEPGFTETARKNNITGTVRLRMVLSANGQVSNISVVKGLPDGLTEKAIAAARQIRFQPATKDGRPVSQYVTVEYNFNIY